MMSALIGSPTWSTGQTPPGRWVTADEINATADALCTRARAREGQLNEALGRAADFRSERDELRGALRVCRTDLAFQQEQKTVGYPLAFRIALDVAVVATSALAGAAMVSDAPSEVRWGLAVGAGVLGGLRVVIEF